MKKNNLKIEFDLLILDIDGVMTDGTKLYDTKGKVFAKRYNDRDFTAIKRFKKIGINVCFLSGDKGINKIVAKDRNIDFYYGRNSKGEMDKVSKFYKIKEIYKAKKIAYVGDDYYDLEVLNLADVRICPSDAIEDIKNCSNIKLLSKGGEGAVAELFKLYMHSK
tara:strand:+ start:771 stop:1262 length:492 start_codon:yes stop_codon:yes gene_type:complete